MILQSQNKSLIRPFNGFNDFFRGGVRFTGYHQPRTVYASDRLMMPGGFTAVSFLFNDDKRNFHFFPGQPGMSAEYLLSFNMRVEYASV